MAPRKKKVTTEQKEQKEQYKCKYCNAAFSRETTLFSHVCEKKRRWLNKDEKFTKIGFEAYSRFYVGYIGKKVTFEDFANSKYYTAFTKFGKQCIDLNVQNPSKFIDFVLEFSIPVDKWCKDVIYEEFIRWQSIKEPVESSLERTILAFHHWALETGEPWNRFFEKAQTTTAVSFIRQGKISPWLIYHSPNAYKMFDRMSSEQIDLIYEYVKPEEWKKKFLTAKEEVEIAKYIIKEANL